MATETETFSLILINMCISLYILHTTFHAAMMGQENILALCFPDSNTDDLSVHLIWNGIGGG